MSKYLTGLNKGEEIMIAHSNGQFWFDHRNNIFIEREFVNTPQTLDTFRVSERLRGNTHTIWVKGVTFEEALNLAERLVVGKDYIPPVRNKIATEEKVLLFNAGDILPGDFHLHQINDSFLARFYETDVMNRFEVSVFSVKNADGNPVASSNKKATVVSVDENENLLIVYHYDNKYFTGTLKRK